MAELTPNTNTLYFLSHFLLFSPSVRGQNFKCFEVFLQLVCANDLEIAIRVSQ